MLFLETFGRWFGTGLDHLLLVSGLRPFGWSYRVIYVWLPFLLGLRHLGEGTLRTEAGCHFLLVWPIWAPQCELRPAATCASGNYVLPHDGRCLGQVWSHLMGITVQVYTGCPFCSAWSCLLRAIRTLKASHCLFRVYAPL